MLAYLNQCSRLLTGFFNELRLLKMMLAYLNQVSRSLSVCFNELRLLKLPIYTATELGSTQS
jgi:hypothetical protein